jgi:replicative DNA helicase
MEYFDDANYLENFSSINAEHSVIGAMLIDPGCYSMFSWLTASMFYYGQNAGLAEIIIRLINDNSYIDPVIISDEYKTKHNENLLPYLTEIVQNVPGSAGATNYAEIVRDKWLRRELVLASNNIRQNVLSSSDKNINDLIDESQKSVCNIGNIETDDESENVIDVLNQFVDELERRFNSDGEIQGLSSGFADLDDLWQGLRPGSMNVIAGRPKMGKTTLAMNIAESAAFKQNKNVLVASLEMSKVELMERMVASLGSIDLSRLISGKLQEDDWPKVVAASSIMKQNENNLHIVNKPGLHINQLKSICRRHKLKHGALDLVVVDYLQLMKIDRKSEHSSIGEITREFKALMGELGCPGIMLSQLNRECEKRPNKRPTPSDLRASGSIEEDADMVVFVYRDEVYNEDTANKGIGEAITALNRKGKAGTAHLAFQGQHSRFTSLSFDAIQAVKDNEESQRKSNEKKSRNFF